MIVWVLSFMLYNPGNQHESQFAEVFKTEAACRAAYRPQADFELKLPEFAGYILIQGDTPCMKKAVRS